MISWAPAGVSESVANELAPRRGRTGVVRLGWPGMLPKPDDLIQAAVRYAAARPVFGCGKKPEACLVEAIRRAIEDTSGLSPLPTEQRYELPGWHPGGVDLSRRSRRRQ